MQQIATERVVLLGGPADGQCVSICPDTRKIVQLSSPGFIAVYERDVRRPTTFAYTGSEAIRHEPTH
jgi:hypothetical protein